MENKDVATLINDLEKLHVRYEAQHQALQQAELSLYGWYLNLTHSLLPPHYLATARTAKKCTHPKPYQWPWSYFQFSFVPTSFSPLRIMQQLIPQSILCRVLPHWWNLGVYIGVLYEVLRILGVILQLKGKNANVFHRFTPRFVVAEAR